MEERLARAILDRAENARRTGVWWEPDWWRIDGALPEDMDVERYEAAVRVLRTVFDERWFLDTPPTHPAKFLMHDAGPVAIYESVFFAEQLTALRTADGDHEGVIARLRNVNEYRGACREMFACWLLAGSELRFRLVPRATRGTNDLATIGAPIDFAIEVTGISHRDADLRVRELMHQATRTAAEHLDMRGYDLWLDGEQVCEYRDAGDPNVAARIVQATGLAASNASTLPDSSEVSIPEIGRLVVRAAGPGQAHGPALDLARMAAKVASSAIAKEAQLPHDRPGVILLEFPFALVDLRDATTRLAAKLASSGPKTDRIAGFVFFANYTDSQGRHVALRAFDNPTATISLLDLPWTLVNQHGRPPR